MKQCVFLASNEGDLLILAGISSLIKELIPESRNTLLLPKYRRVYERAEDYKQYFDEIIKLDGIYFTLRPKGILRNILAINKILKLLLQFRGSIFFLFDVYSLVELTVYSFVKRHKNARLVTVTAFEGDEINFENLETVMKGTVTQSLYSVLLSGRIFYEYKVKNSDNKGLNYFKGDCDLQLRIKRSKIRNTHVREVSELPYPVLFLADRTNNAFNQYKIIKPSAVIMLVESQIANWTENYWGKTNGLIEILLQRGMNIYVKDHPNCTHSDVNLLTSKNIIVLPKEICAELLFINNPRNIVGVFGHGTTSLITASWLMIPAYDTSKYYVFNENVQKKLSGFLTLGQNIQVIKDCTEIKAIDLSAKKVNDISLQLQRQIWDDVILKELQKLNE